MPLWPFHRSLERGAASRGGALSENPATQSAGWRGSLHLPGQKRTQQQATQVPLWPLHGCLERAPASRGAQSVRGWKAQARRADGSLHLLSSEVQLVTKLLTAGGSHCLSGHCTGAWSANLPAEEVRGTGRQNDSSCNSAPDRHLILASLCSHRRGCHACSWCSGL